MPMNVIKVIHMMEQRIKHVHDIILKHYVDHGHVTIQHVHEFIDHFITKYNNKTIIKLFEKEILLFPLQRLYEQQ